MIDDGVEVGDMPGDGQAMWIGLRIKRPPRASLIPINHDEMVFELAVEIAKQRPLSPARTAMEPKQHRCAPISATRQQVQLCVIQG